LRPRPSAAHTRRQHRSHVAPTVHSVRSHGELRAGRGQVPPTRGVSTGHTSRALFTASAARANSARGMTKRRPHTTSAQATRRARWSQRPQSWRTPFKARPSAAHTRRQHRPHVALLFTASAIRATSARGMAKRRPHTTSAQATRRARWSQRFSTASSVKGAAKCRPHTDVSAGHTSRSLLTASAAKANSATGAAKCRPHTRPQPR